MRSSVRVSAPTVIRVSFFFVCLLNFSQHVQEIATRHTVFQNSSTVNITVLEVICSEFILGLLLPHKIKQQSLSKENILCIFAPFLTGPFKTLNMLSLLVQEEKTQTFVVYYWFLYLFLHTVV